MTVATALTTAPAPSEDDAAIVLEKLRPYAVLADKPARRTLYTWTTKAQIDELRRNPTLLTRSESVEFGSSYFDQVLDARAKRGEVLAKLLRTQAFAKARYAWPAPWATLLGFADETYGEELIQVNLKPDAWLVIFRTSRPDLSVVDMDNRPVPVAEALAHPERLAAGYFVHDDPVTGYAASTAGPFEREAYREYVLFNESMIASYAASTDDIAREIARSADAVDAFSKYMRAHPSSRLFTTAWGAAVAKEAWTRPEPPKDLQELYEACLSFPDTPYLPSSDSLRSLVDKLRKLRPSGAPIMHNPAALFPKAAAGAPSSPPRTTATPKRRGTM